jgi:hypothetical protein
MHHYVVTLNLLGDCPELAISESAFLDTKKSFQHLNRLLLLEERFDSLATNFLEFEALITSRLLQFEYIGFVDGNHQMMVRRDANRVLMNVLTSARAYIDQLPQILNEIFGKESASAVHCTELLRKAYDERPGYRIFEALRNHTQHIGFPIHLTSYGDHMIGDYPKLLSTKSFSVMTKPQTLAADQKLKASILKELSDMGEQVNLRPLLCQYIAGIADAHYYVRSEVTPIVDAASLDLQNRLSEYIAAYPNAASPFAYAVHIKDKEWADRVPLGTGNEKYLEYLRSINVHLNHADNHFLIGDVPEET